MTNGQKLRIIVDKKDKVHVDHIYITGNENISDTRLKWKMKKTREQVRFTIVEDLFGRLFRWKFNDLKQLKWLFF